MIFRSGQTLTEILVAVAVGTIMILGAIMVIAPALKGNTLAAQTQIGIGLGKELMDNVRAFSESDWHNIYDLSKGSGNKYYLNSTSSPFTVATGTQSIVVATTTYSRYFYVDNVSRDAGGAIVQVGGTNDPSTQKLTVIYSWPQSSSRVLSEYLTRFGNQSYTQSDWSAGPIYDQITSTTVNTFASSTGIDYSTTTGSIRIQGI